MKQFLLVLTLVILIACNNDGDPGGGDKDSTQQENIAPNEPKTVIDSVKYLDFKGDTITVFNDGSTRKQ